MDSLSSCEIRKKAVWGRSLLIGLMAVLFVVSAAPAEAQRGGSKFLNNVLNNKAARPNRPASSITSSIRR